MKINVHILATCLNGDLNPTLLVFKTLRVGFPTADVTVFGNDLAPVEAREAKAACDQAKCKFVWVPRTAHDVWIEALLEKSEDPFWLCDTDMVFHSEVERFSTEGTMLKGRYEPPFIEPWTGTTKSERLHTSLLYMDAPELRMEIRAWVRKWHPPYFNFRPKVELIRQCYVPVGAGKPPIFQDTCAGLYGALGGERFSDEENAAFDHLHCGTYVERMKNAVPGLAEAHAQIYAHPEDAKHLKPNQKEFYARFQPSKVA